MYFKDAGFSMATIFFFIALESLVFLAQFSQLIVKFILTICEHTQDFITIVYKKIFLFVIYMHIHPLELVNDMNGCQKVFYSTKKEIIQSHETYILFHISLLFVYHTLFFFL